MRRLKLLATAVLTVAAPGARAQGGTPDKNRTATAWQAVAMAKRDPKPQLKNDPFSWHSPIK
jgi:hypothetical protein